MSQHPLYREVLTSPIPSLLCMLVLVLLPSPRLCFFSTSPFASLIDFLCPPSSSSCFYPSSNPPPAHCGKLEFYPENRAQFAHFEVFLGLFSHWQLELSWAHHEKKKDCAIYVETPKSSPLIFLAPNSRKRPLRRQFATLCQFHAYAPPTPLFLRPLNSLVPRFCLPPSFICSLLLLLSVPPPSRPPPLLLPLLCSFCSPHPSSASLTPPSDIFCFYLLPTLLLSLH